jgi:Flp pilus assembly CpaE family ATPase
VIGVETLSDGLLNFFLLNPFADVNVVIRALRGDGIFRSLAEPNLLALDGSEASFLAGGEFPFPVAQAGAQAGAVTIQWREFGVRLNFRPTITGAGNIRLLVAPEVSSLDFTTGLTVGGFTVPALSSRRTETEIELRDGQTFAIAGLIDNNMMHQVDRIPVLGTCPSSARSSSSRERREERTELVVLVTPRLVQPLDAAPAVPGGEPEEWPWMGRSASRHTDQRPHLDRRRVPADCGRPWRSPGWTRTSPPRCGGPSARSRRSRSSRSATRRPQLLFLDLGKEPETGIKLAQFLVEGLPDLRVVATGPELEPKLLMEAMRAGVADYLPRPLDRQELVAALVRTRKKLGFSLNGNGRGTGQLLSVFSAKGGSGSTTIATNLAIHIQRLTGKKTLLVDMDLELGEIAVFLGMQPRFNFVDMIRNFHRMDADLLASYIEKHDSGVHLLSAPFHPEKAESVAPEEIQKILQFLKQHYDYVVVDTSKSFSPATLATFQQADTIYLVTTVDLPSLRNIKRCLPLLERVTGGDAERVKLVVNRHQSTDLISLDEVEETLDMKVAHTLANDFAAVSESINTGKPVVLDGKSKFGQDIQQFGAAVAGLTPSTNGKGGAAGLDQEDVRQEGEEGAEAGGVTLSPWLSSRGAQRRGI